MPPIHIATYSWTQKTDFKERLLIIQIKYELLFLRELSALAN